MKKRQIYIIICGTALRIVYFTINLFIGGNHIDEAMLGLNASNISRTLTDAAGEKLPIYFDTWLIGGQSPIPTYLSALFIKIFGVNLFAIRFPMLITSIIGLIAFVAFVNEVFNDKKTIFILDGLACVSPWLLFSGVFVLDCNYLAYMLIFAFYYMAKALNTKMYGQSAQYKKLKNLVFSMLFFSLGFYCYIASVLLIPAILFVMYVVLIIKRKIGIVEVSISIISVFLFSLPFILFGLVNVGIINDFNLFGISLSKMPYYSRSESVAFLNVGLMNYLKTGMINLFSSLGIIITVDTAAIAIGMNIFQYANLLGGFFFLIALFRLTKAFLLKTSTFSFMQKLFALSFFSGVLFFCFNVNDVSFAYAYRYGVLTYMLLFFEGIGLSCFVNSLKKVNVKKTIIIYLALSVVLFNVEFFGLYNKQTKTTDDLIYGDSLYSCLNRAKRLDFDRIEFIENFPKAQNRTSVYCRFYYTVHPSDYEFCSIKKEFENRLNNEDLDISLTQNNDIKFTTDKNLSNGKAFIIRTDEASNIKKIPENYVLENMGCWSIIYYQE